MALQLRSARKFIGKPPVLISRHSKIGRKFTGKESFIYLLSKTLKHKIKFNRCIFTAQGLWSSFHSEVRCGTMQKTTQVTHNPSRSSLSSRLQLRNSRSLICQHGNFSCRWRQYGNITERHFNLV